MRLQVIDLRRYDGGKGRIYRHLINQMPPHDTFVSAFAGGCAVAMHKRPARRNILIDRDGGVISAWLSYLVKNGGTAVSSKMTMGSAIVMPDGARWCLICGDALRILPGLGLGQDALVYADPPYLFETRTSKRPLYRYEMGTEVEHGRMLDVLDGLACKVMLSGYWSALYVDRLDWRIEKIKTYDRAHKERLEYVWFNYPEPLQLHDYSFLGENFRERERIKRKAGRWVSRFLNLPVLERRAIVGELERAGVL